MNNIDFVFSEPHPFSGFGALGQTNHHPSGSTLGSPGRAYGQTSSGQFGVKRHWPEADWPKANWPKQVKRGGLRRFGQRRSPPTGWGGREGGGGEETGRKGFKKGCAPLNKTPFGLKGGRRGEEGKGGRRSKTNTLFWSSKFWRLSDLTPPPPIREKRSIFAPMFR